MIAYLFLLVIILPVIELLVLVEIGQLTEWWIPIVWVIAAGLAGLAVVRWQGWRTAQKIREEAQAGRMPGDAMIDGFLILLAGILLIVPGVITDVAAVALLIPHVRRLVIRGMKSWFRRNVNVQITHFQAGGWNKAGPGFSTGGNDKIIDARVISTRVEDSNSPG